MGWSHEMLVEVQWLMMHCGSTSESDRLTMLEAYLIRRINR